MMDGVMAMYCFNKSKLGFYINRYDNFAESDFMLETWNYVVGTYDKDAWYRRKSLC